MTRALACAVGACLAFAGCGFGEGAARDGGASIRITQDFGHEALSSERVKTIHDDETVMRLLESRHDVDTRFGGKFVDAIDGVEGGHDSRDWFYYVNGFWADKGAADREVQPGDVIQWDNHDWTAVQHIPAIVGAYPEPFRSGSEGKRMSVRLECAEPDDEACTDVKDALSRAGTTVGAAQLGTSGEEGVIRVLVGRWDELREIRTPATLEQGPGSSGVFARFADDGTRLELLDEKGQVAREAGVGTGLVAATQLEEQPLVWIVTGLDDVGVQAAAASLDERSLRDAFAVAATPDGPVKLPIVEGGG